MKFVFYSVVSMIVAIVYVLLFTFALSMLNKSTLDLICGMLLIVILLSTAITGLLKLGKKMLKKLNVTNLLALFCLIPTAGCGCERIDAGNVGVEIELAGSNRGVQNVPIVTGYVFYNPLTEKVLEYPIYVQTAVWTHDTTEGHPMNEELSFNSKEGLVLSGDISLSFQIKPDHVPAFYVKFRNDNINLFTHGYLRNVARDNFNEVAGLYAVEDLYGPKKEEFINAVKARINKQLEPIGVSIEQLGFVGAPRLPEVVKTAINAKIAATQQAIQVENELRQAEAQARKQVASAEGTAKSRIALAEGEAKANAVLASSVTPSLLAWRQLEITEKAISRWNGARPMVEGSSSGMLLQLSVPTK